MSRRASSSRSALVLLQVVITGCCVSSAPIGPAVELVVVDRATLGPVVSTVVIRATLDALPAEELTLESQQVLGYVAGNGPGTYRLEATAEGYQDWNGEIRVGGRCDDTEMAHVVVTMTPLSPG